MNDAKLARPSRPRKQGKWQLNHARIAAWRIWDGEVAIYDDLSGDTFKLDLIMAEIFIRLQKTEASPDELVQHLSQVLDIETDLRLERLVEIALKRFEDGGLATPVETAASETI